MLFHNVYDIMSSTTTPTRTGRGMPVPGIDTRSAAEKSHQTSLQFQGWPLTPPQSANTDSRRPSLAYSALSADSHSGPSSINGYSQPATPVHSVNSSHHDFKSQWTDSSEMHAPTSAGIMDGCGAGPHQMYVSTMANASVCGMPAANAMDSLSVQMSHMGSPMQPAWPQHQPHINSYHGLPSDLGTTLFQSSQSLGHGQVSAPMYGQHAPSMQSPLETSAFSRYDTPMSSARHYQQPQVVVPSQVAPPEDYTMESQGYDVKAESSDGFASSFESSNSWVDVQLPSPVDNYFVPSDDEGYALIKDEPAQFQNSFNRPTSFFDAGHSSRQKKRSNRRSRKTGEGTAWHQHSIGETTVECKGKPFKLDLKDGQHGSLSEGLTYDSSKDPKPFKCTDTTKNGHLCTAAFKRGEHLKRHQQSHAPSRYYVCPLPDCDKEIGRPDNAGDHFKTHLRPHTKGKRNKHCSWDVLEAGIERQFPEKVAVKLLTNLRKWMIMEGEKMRLSDEAEKMMKQQMVGRW